MCIIEQLSRSIPTYRDNNSINSTVHPSSCCLCRLLVVDGMFITMVIFPVPYRSNRNRCSQIMSISLLTASISPDGRKSGRIPQDIRYFLACFHRRHQRCLVSYSITRTAIPTPWNGNIPSHSEIGYASGSDKLI